MKINTRKLLLLLSGPGVILESSLYLPYLWSSLTPSGRRSLITQLVRQQLVSRQTSGKTDFLALTAYGQQVAKELFPVLRSGEVKEGPAFKTCLVLHTPPAFDPHFIKLRHQLRRERIPELTPATYLSGGPLSGKLKQLLISRYFPNVAVFAAGQWQIGNEEIFFAQSAAQTDLHHLASGISSQIDELISSKITFFIANHQSKIAIISVFERIFNFLEQAPEYFSSSKIGSTSGKLLLERFQLECFSQP